MHERHDDRADAALGALLETRRDAPPISPAFLGAVRKRRTARRIRAGSAVVGALVIAATAWVAVSRRSAPAMPSPQLATGEMSPQEFTMPTLAALRSERLPEGAAVAMNSDDHARPNQLILRAGDSVDTTLMDRFLRGL